MKTYIIAFISFFDNEMKMHKVQASSEVDALEKGLADNGYQIGDDLPRTVENIKELAFDCDGAISAFLVE